MKILLTGSTGQLGNELIKSKPNYFNLIETNRSNLDLENPQDCYDFVEKYRPDWIINAAAYTNVDKAETEPELTFKINYEAPKAFAYAIKKYNGKLMQISTDYVFNGVKNSPYKVTDKKNPQNTYGKSKNLAEEAITKILKEDNKLTILRTSWLIGPVGKNFLLTILDLLEKKEKIHVVNDQIGSITSTFSLSKIIWKLIQKNDEYSSKHKIFPKYFHWNNRGSISWYELALAIKKISERISLIKNPAEILPTTTEKYKFLAKRPKYSVLDCSETEHILKINNIHWQDSLLEIINSILKNKI